MFGYVLPAKPDMKVRDFETYRAIYCGLCKQLGQTYGQFSRFLLNYDLVLLSLLSDALSGDRGAFLNEACFANPILKRPMLHDTTGLQLGADGLILLSWHKVQDNLQDENLPQRLAYGCTLPAMKKMYRTARHRHPELSEILGEQMQRQAELEKSGCRSLDEACDPTARMCEALFSRAAAQPSQEKVLSRLGLFCGQIIYLLDAAEDYSDDKANNRYNVFVQMGLSQQEASETAKRRCNMAAGEVALAYNLLTPTLYKDILDNIFFLGLPHAISMAGTKRTKGNAHGQIERI